MEFEKGEEEMNWEFWEFFSGFWVGVGIFALVLRTIQDWKDSSDRTKKSAALKEREEIVALLKALKDEYDDRKNQFGFHRYETGRDREPDYLWHKHENTDVIAAVEATLKSHGGEHE